MYLVAPFTVQYKKILEPIQTYEMCHFRAQNDTFLLNKFFFVKTINITFSHLLALFIVQNFKKIIRAAPEFFPKWFICPKQNFFWKELLIFFHLPIGPFHYAKF